MIAFAGLADLEQMAALHARAFDRPWGASELERLLANPAAFALIAERAGFIMAWSASADAEILTLAVAPEARRQGLGAALVEAAAGAAAARGAASMFLAVAEDNAAALGLYAKLGFVEVGRRRSYYEGGADAIVLRKHLTPITPGLWTVRAAKE